MDFNQRAKEWDTPERVDRAKLIAQEIAKFFSETDNQTGLEFGCGTGLVSFELKSKFSHITLLDTARGMIDVVKEKMKIQKVEHFSPIKGTLESNFRQLEPVDGIFTSMVLHHIEDLDTVLGQLYRLLNRGGKLCIVDLNEDDGSFHKHEEAFNGHHGFKQSALRSKLDRVGYRNITSYTFFRDTKKIDDQVMEYGLFIMVAVK